MKKIIRSNCAKASDTELKLIKDEFPEASVLGVSFFLVPLIVVTAIYTWIVTSSYNAGYLAGAMFGMSAYLCLLVGLGGMALQAGVSAIALYRKKAYVSMCIVHQVHKNNDRYWITCETNDVPGLFHIRVGMYTYYTLKDNKDTVCKVAWVGLMKPCLILAD